MVTIVEQLRGKIFLFGILFLVISISLMGNINAQPPFQEGASTFVEGFFVEFTEIETYQFGNISFNAHVFNISNGVRITNTTTECNYHLFDNTGDHILNQIPMGFDVLGLDWELNVLQPNFTRMDFYSYLIVCNDSTNNLGGFVSVGFEVTPTGNKLDIQQSVLVLSLILILLFLTSAFLFFGNEIEFIPVKIFLIALGGLFLMLTIGFSVNVVNELMLLGSVFSGTFGGLYILILALVSGGFIAILLFLITSVVKAFHKSKGTEIPED